MTNRTTWYLFFLIVGVGYGLLIGWSDTAIAITIVFGCLLVTETVTEICNDVRINETIRDLSSQVADLTEATSVLCSYGTLTLSARQGADISEQMSQQSERLRNLNMRRFSQSRLVRHLPRHLTESDDDTSLKLLYDIFQNSPTLDEFVARVCKDEAWVKQFLDNFRERAEHEYARLGILFPRTQSEQLERTE